MYKAVFSDFDGTLLTSDHRISPKTLDALQRITKQGIPFTPISARSPLGIWPYAKLIENYNIIVAFKRERQYIGWTIFTTISQIQVMTFRFIHNTYCHFHIITFWLHCGGCPLQNLFF